MSAEEAREGLARRAEAIEAGYEMMLAYASQGLPTDQGASTGGQLREFLKRFDDALTGLADHYRAYVVAESMEPRVAINDFLDVLARDASAAQAGIRVVLGQTGISSQLVDNLNASIHVRALLTDIFLIDQLIKTPR